MHDQTLSVYCYNRVYRYGQAQIIPTDQLLVGDVQIIEAGEIMQADGLLLESDGLVVDESSINGDSDGINKNIPTWIESQKGNPFIISGSRVIQGSGKILVLVVREDSHFIILQKQARQAVSAQVSTEEAEGEQAGGGLRKISPLGKIAAVITFVCIDGHTIHEAYVSEDFFDSFFTWGTLSDLLEQLMAAVTILWINEPSESPIATTFVLAYTTSKTKNYNNLMRSLQAIELLGDSDNICTDVTGIITKDSMAVSHFLIQEQSLDKMDQGLMKKSVQELFIANVCLNTSAEPIFAIDQAGSLRIEQVGDKEDFTLLIGVLILGSHYIQVGQNQTPNIIKVLPFSFDTNTRSIVTRFKGKIHVFSKGDPEYLLKKSVFFINANGDIVPITEQFKNTLLSKSRQFNQATIRSLLLAYRLGENEDENTPYEKIENDLIVIGLVGISNPIKKMFHMQFSFAAKQSEESPELAVAIAKQAGLNPADYTKKDNDYTVMTGKQFRTFVEGLKKDDRENFKLASEQLKVLARSSPADKYTMLAGLKQLEHIVDTTGHEVKDVPVLKKADIGFSLPDGTDEARQASEVIFLNHNISSVVDGVKWGRNSINSIRKFLQFQFTLTLSVLVIELTDAALFNQSPLSTFQMLFIELICDFLISIAIVSEPPSDDILQGKLYSPQDTIISPKMWRNIITQVSLQIAILAAILFKGPQLFGVPSSIGVDEGTQENGEPFCIFFPTFVLLQVFNQINSTKLRSDINVFSNFINNTYFVVILIILLIIQFLCIQYGGEYLGTVPLSAEEHLLCILIALLPIFVSLIFKIIVPASIFKSLSKRKTE